MKPKIFTIFFFTGNVLLNNYSVLCCLLWCCFMRKKKKSVLLYVCWWLFVLCWVVIIFLVSKGYDLSRNWVMDLFSWKRSPVSEQIVFSWEDTSTGESLLTEADLSFLSWFLSEDIQFTAKDAESLWNIREKIVVLEQIYSQQRTQEVIQLLLDAYMLDNQFDKAKAFYNSLPDAIKSYLSNGLLFEIWINSFSQTTDTEYNWLKVLLDKYHNQKIFSEQKYSYYKTAFHLIDWNYIDAQNEMQSLIWTKYQDFVYAIQSAFNQYLSLKDVPEYYQDGLVAYQLMNQWFLAGAKRKAIRLVNQYPSYILPYQVLANVDFLMWKWDSASRYFHQLLQLDPQEKSSYLYYLWICYYHLWDYSNAVLYLSQISDSKILLDSDRYLILSYIALGESDRIFVWWQRLLWYPSVKASDFYSFYEEAFWKPYRRWRESYYLKQNVKLVQDYLSACLVSLKWEDLQVCTYWQLWLSAIQWNPLDEEMQLQLVRLARKYAKPELFQLLWDDAVVNWELEEATSSYMRALWLSLDNEEKNYLKQKILEINQLN